MAFTHDSSLLKKGISYEDYLKEINTQIPNPSAEEGDLKLLPFKVKNLEVMWQLDEEIVISEALRKAIGNAPKMEWLVITEGWCGDAAYIVPVLAAAEKQMPEKVNHRLYFRDRNPEFMDAHLTNGGRSIPKLVILDEKLNLLNSWGPRPKKLQQEMDVWKEQGMELKQLIPKVADWYRKDKTKAVQEELSNLFFEI